jgi:hypothetical protein
VRKLQRYVESNRGRQRDRAEATQNLADLQQELNQLEVRMISLLHSLDCLTLCRHRSFPPWWLPTACPLMCTAGDKRHFVLLYQCYTTHAASVPACATHTVFAEDGAGGAGAVLHEPRGRAQRPRPAARHLLRLLSRPLHRVRPPPSASMVGKTRRSCSVQSVVRPCDGAKL